MTGLECERHDHDMCAWPNDRQIGRQKKIYGPGERHGRVDTRVIVWLFAEGVRGCGSSAGASRLSLPQAMCVLLCALARACVN